MPSKSQMALALREKRQSISSATTISTFFHSRLGVYLIQEAASIALGEDSRKAPWLFLQRLHVLDVNYKHVSRLCRLNVKGPGQVVDFGQVDIANIVGGVIVFDLATSPVDAFNLDGFAVLDGAVAGN